ncbi:glycoside hydrolase family 43 protein [Zopfia rhizophila CBS 207.26]|uniref:Arabinan endo-1,5-alpha-L-arabinosidase n=1 Tax=Zopfia rhizophila CBS 207.26 TaxID=1314779 RepID=A0A6A6E856_9PEZI|nr:glycoside hydrolase family 43 protein [Zopfia rhizophila CBS 207.26]
MKLHTSLLLTTLLLDTTLAQKWPNPEPCTGECRIHDPALARSENGTYYLFGSAPGVTVKTAPSLNGPWSEPKKVFNTEDQLGAPDIMHVNGKWWLYYQRTKISTQESNISVASSPSLSSPFVDHGLLDIPPGNEQRDYNRIDANLFYDSNGRDLYLNFGSFWDDIFQLRLSDPKTVISDSFSHLEKNKTEPGFPGESSTGANPSEGAFEFKWNGKYYLFWSSGNCCHTTKTVPLGDEYKIMVCRSDKATGPFVDKAGKNCVSENGGTMILGTHDNVYAPGGQGVRYDDELKSVILYYHWLRFDNQEEPATFGWNYLGWDGEGWPFVTEKGDGTKDKGKGEKKV